MCANFEPIRKSQASVFTSNQLSFDFKEDIYPNYDTPLLFAMPTDEQMQWRQVRFGLVPKWADSTDIARHAYNARSETVDTKPSFREAWHNNQFALIPVQTIFEPKYINGKPQRWGIKRKDAKPFTIAAIYEVTRIKGEIIRSMSMLTINADNHPLMSQFHRPHVEKRSIVVIPPKLRMAWLQCNYQYAHEFLQPLADEFVAMARPRLNSSNHPNQNSLF